MTDVKRSAAGVRMIVLDVDGVLTDGSINLADGGHEFKRYHVRDGFAIKAWMSAGYLIGVITGRGGPALTARVVELGIEHVIERSKDKAADLERLARSVGMRLDELAFMGDDWPDVPAMRRAGYAMAPGDAAAEVRAIADFVAESGGGRGAVREAVEHLLNARGDMQRILARYDL